MKFDDLVLEDSIVLLAGTSCQELYTLSLEFLDEVYINYVMHQRINILVSLAFSLAFSHYSFSLLSMPYPFTCLLMQHNTFMKLC